MDPTDTRLKFLKNSYAKIAANLLSGQLTIEQFASEQAAIHLALEKRSDYDGLVTTFLNNNGFNKALEQSIKTIRRLKVLGCLLALDIDYLKRFNDAFGHPAGDKLIQTYGSVIEQQTRTSDIKGRVGGDEFCLFLLGTDTNGALQVAERVRLNITSQVNQTFPNLPWEQTVSIGVYQVTSEDTALSIREHADQALYQAKNKRNTSIVFAENIVA